MSAQGRPLQQSVSCVVGCLETLAFSERQHRIDTKKGRRRLTRWPYAGLPSPNWRLYNLTKGDQNKTKKAASDWLKNPNEPISKALADLGWAKNAAKDFFTSHFGSCGMHRVAVGVRVVGVREQH